MKKIFSFFLFSLTLFLVFLSCNKNSTDPIPVTYKHAWAVGTPDSTGYGLILHSADAGQTWERKGEGSNALKNAVFTGVYAISEQEVWVVGEDNLVVKTADGGKTWHQIDMPPSTNFVELMCISVFNKNQIWISGAPGIIYHSPDGGKTWTSLKDTILTDRILQGVHAINDEVIYVAGGVKMNSNDPFVARTLDGGASWDSLVLPHTVKSHPFIGIQSAGLNDILVYGAASYFLQSTDMGLSWTYDSISNTGGGGTGGSDINDLKMLDRDTWWGAFDYDGIFITENGGKQWSAQESVPPLGMWLFGIDYFDRETCVIVGQGTHSNTGKIMRTTNGGKDWELILETKAWLQKVSIVK